MSFSRPLLIAVLSLLFLCGCAAGNGATTPPLLVPQGLPSANPQTNSKAYLIVPGDLLDIKFFYTPEFDQIAVPVRPDGMISLPLIGDEKAAGVSPMDLNRTITEKYERVLFKPTVSVIVKGFAAQKAYVGGEVNSPGLIELTGNVTAFQAIVLRGGFKHTGKESSVVILRDEGGARPRFITVNLEEVLKGSPKHDDVVLKPCDVVFVPKTTIAKLDQFVDEYIKQLIPVTYNLGFSFLYNLKPETVVK